MILVPDVSQTGNNVISQEFLNQYAEGIMARLCFTLHTMEGQRWSKPKQAGLDMLNYKTAITDAMADISMKGKTQPDGCEAAPRYFQTRYGSFSG